MGGKNVCNVLIFSGFELEVRYEGLKVALYDLR